MMDPLKSFFIGLGLALWSLCPLLALDPSPALVAAKTRSAELCAKLNNSSGYEHKIALLNQTNTLATVAPETERFLQSATPEERYVFLLALALNQGEVICEGWGSVPDTQHALADMIQTLVGVERFYQPIGGLLGYHNAVISLMAASESPFDASSYLPPPLQDIRTQDANIWTVCYDGVAALDRTAEIFVLGGAGDRLHLMDEATGEPLPAACLVFCGRSLFEGLMRDVEALEYWRFRAFGTQVSSPVLIMTSLEKRNDEFIEAMGTKAHWFGHNPSNIRRMVQPLVPVIDSDGQWVLTAPLKLALKPGGHGVIWKLAKDSGSLSWLGSKGVESAIVRQVNNPFASIDINFPALIGYGVSNRKAFGFLSTPSKPGFAEGLNVLALQREGSITKAAISNIEYTQFSTLKAVRPDLFTEGVCPANTNLLYINLNEIDRALAKDPVPGMIVNAKSTVDVTRNGQTVKKNAGRLESSMQNIADALASPVDPKNPSQSNLDTFLLLQSRDKLMSVTKKAYQKGQNALETPESCLYDWTQSMRALLAGRCQISLPEEQTLDDFLQNGPAYTFLFNPALGPMWEVIGQKLSKGSIAKGSELELEIAELACHNLSLNGSFRILAKNPTGPIDRATGRVFSERVPRARLNNVSVINKGVVSKDASAFVKGTQERAETCEIILEGCSEFDASDVTISGSFRLVVPDGYRATLHTNDEGQIFASLNLVSQPTWTYTVTWQRGLPPKLTEQRQG